MRVAASFIAFVGTIAVVWAGLYYGGIVGNRVQANYQERVVTSQVEQRVRTAEFAQDVYEQFFTDCNSVTADNLKILAAQERVRSLRTAPDDTFGQKATRVADAVSDLAGLRQAQADAAARYNAAAHEYTRGQFLDASLPSRIVPPYTRTVCE